ncbi:formate hydrogenlyase complex iron-sulfur subunit [Azospirillum thermophilum]|uniref:Formate hydrogenlyase complex iron-sulfur subunit n=1 Tax=Azospirillum thermophilum TaxID=2202148 RepID=A0A2S2CMB2_9PROT|nr:formate hydrogenlyase complex iron-sulfur subunit [Azospirillum thermophilum]AWK85658.1 formate hydrogenlyase complex iron-sulfur subunit [Azospirillum thermophilum]
MLKLLKEILRSGEATVQYPFAPLEVCKDFRGKPEHDAELCIACAACTVACPPNAIQMETDTAAGTRTWSINYGRCVFCGRCEESCPTGAIRLSADFELAVGNKADLTRKAVFTLAECACCGKAFAPAKEVDYVARLLGQSARNQEEADRLRLTVSTCPECKRKQDAHQVARMEIDRQLGRQLETTP